MYLKNKIAVLLLCFAMMFNIVGCNNGAQNTNSKKDDDKNTTSSVQNDADSSENDMTFEEDSDSSGNDEFSENGDSSEDNTSSSKKPLSSVDKTDGSKQNNTPSYIYVEKEKEDDGYQTDRYIPTVEDVTKVDDESNKEISAKEVSWDGPAGYVIVIPKGNAVAKETAELLQSYYKTSAKAELEIVTDDTSAKEKEIVVGSTNRYKYTAKEGEFFAKVDGKKLIFGGGHDVTVKKAAQIQTRLTYKSGKAYEYSGNSDFVGKKFGYSYVWGDEFEGLSLDDKLWNQATKMAATAEMALDNTELTTFTKNGYLNMLALRYWDPKKAGVEYVCPWSVTTMETMSYKYGYVEIRAKMPFVRGAWASFWTSSSGALGPKNPADYSIEVDVFENFASLDTIAPNVHKWYGDGRHTQWGDEGEKYTFDSLNINDEYHIYGFEWTPEKMTMYVDDKPYFTYDHSINFDEGYAANKNKGASDMSGFDTQLYLIFNNHLFTSSSSYLPYDGCEIYPTDLPTEYVIDYVRLYQKNDGISQLYTK